MKRGQGRASCLSSKCFFCSHDILWYAIKRPQAAIIDLRADAELLPEGLPGTDLILCICDIDRGCAAAMSDGRICKMKRDFLAETHFSEQSAALVFDAACEVLRFYETELHPSFDRLHLLLDGFYQNVCFDQDRETIMMMIGKMLNLVLKLNAALWGSVGYSESLKQWTVLVYVNIEERLCERGG